MRLSHRLPLLILKRARKHHSAVLAYHSVSEVAPEHDPHLLCTPPDEMRNHILLLQQAGFEFVTASEFVCRTANNGGTPPPGMVALTFDDGLQDNLTELLPILQETGVPASVYVTTGLMGKPYPWTPDEARLRLMTEAEVAELAAAGVEIGAHTVTHPDMSTLGFDENLDEASTSRQELERITGERVTTFAYPYANHNETARDAIREAGFDFALAYGENPDWPSLAFPRIPISRRDHCLTLAMKIARQYGPLADSAPGRALRALVRRLRRPTGEKALQRSTPAPAPDLPPIGPATGPGVDSDDSPHSDHMLATGARAARDAFVRFGGELTGKLASLALFIAMARFLGDYPVGIFVFGLAWVQIATIIIELGYDTYLMRELVGKRDEIKSMVSSAIWWKLRRAVPITALSLFLIWILDYPPEELYVVAILTVGVMFDSISRTLFSAYSAFELGQYVGATLVVQRLFAAVVGIGILVLGGGVVLVSGAYTLGAGVGLAVSLILFARKLSSLQMHTDRDSVRKLRKESRPFAANEIVRVLLDRVDAVLLSLLATQVAVGLYGSAYRLLESTFFIAFGIVGAFAAMYVYLDRTTSPTIGVAYGRSIKLLTCLLMPAAVVLLVLASPLVELLFGADFSGAAEPLAILAPATLLMGLAIVSSTLLISRRDPRIVVRIAAIATITNVALCLVLIPTLEEHGAAIAMLSSAFIWALLSVVPAIREVGGISAPTVFASAIVAGAAMAVAMLLLPWPWSLPAGIAVYALVFAGAERIFCPGDLQFVIALLRRRGGQDPLEPVLLHDEVD